MTGGAMEADGHRGQPAGSAATAGTGPDLAVVGWAGARTGGRQPRRRAVARPTRAGGAAAGRGRHHPRPRSDLSPGHPAVPRPATVDRDRCALGPRRAGACRSPADGRASRRPALPASARSSPRRACSKP